MPGTCAVIVAPMAQQFLLAGEYFPVLEHQFRGCGVVAIPPSPALDYRLLQLVDSSPLIR
jgi:hypothetical protein